MRLHRLELVAIGPFATRQVVDFDQLGAGGLFLLDGPTGAGKTTILDAITFALYGPGERAGDGRLHSDFAGRETEPGVVLDFSVRGVRHRVSRTPEHVRPKRRGDGLTRQPARAHLERWENGAWLSRSSNKAEVALMLADDLGLTREQFTQVVLLQQGDFARFLRASDDERRGVLSKLFGTQLYDRITAELERQGQHAARDLDTAARRVASCVSAAAEAAGLSGTHREELAGLAPQAREQRLTAIGGLLRRRADAADEAQLLASQAAESAREHARAAREQVTRLLRLADARAAIDQHDATRPAYERGIQRLDRARRSAAMRPLLVAVGDAEDALARASAAALIDAETHEVDDADDLVSAAITAAAAAEPARLNSDELRRRRRALRRVTELEQRLGVEAATAAQARDRYHRAVDDHQRLLDARLAGMAATLAAALVDGQPCTVCGATEHPHPAASAAQEVTAAHVSAAKQRRQADEAALRSAEVTAASTEQELADARRSAGDEDAEALDAELARLGEVVEVGERADRMLPALRDWAAARQVHALAVERARDEAGAAGFDSLAQARESVLDAAELADLERRTQAWRREHERRVAAATLAEFDGVDLAGLAAAEQEAAAAGHAAALAIAADTDAAEARGQARLACERFGAALTQLAAAQAEQARLVAGAEPVVYLSKVTRGMAGQRRVALTTFVLRHWFEQVVQAANVRLAAMSSGRYELVRVDETGAKAERAGLTVEVLDRHTGEARSTRSLSGGETFYTSLSLALGLADVVRAEAGGVDLDTLFIDEGFGGLDAQTLDDVMAVIEELREHGRVVGIVSHLAELKELITERVEVRRLPDGSSTLRVVA